MRMLTLPTALLIIVVAITAPCNSAIGQNKTVGKSWSTNDQVSINEINHSDFDALLKKYVDTNGLVNYKTWKASSNDRAVLQTYLAQLGKADATKPASREAQLAYWINAYNAVTLEGILQVYPTTSIRNHTAKAFGYNIWKNLMLISGNQQINLDSIEHKVLRKMNEPRIHFAIVCASIGCPRLLNEAYVPEKLEEQLARNTVDFFSRSQNLQIDESRRRIKLSSIMNWFGGDFGKDQNAQIESVTTYFPKRAKELAQSGKYRVEFLDYDWSLNSQK